MKTIRLVMGVFGFLAFTCVGCNDTVEDAAIQAPSNDGTVASPIPVTPSPVVPVPSPVGPVPPAGPVSPPSPTDIDGDGVLNEKDNCPQQANVKQLAIDAKGEVVSDGSIVPGIDCDASLRWVQPNSTAEAPAGSLAQPYASIQAALAINPTQPARVMVMVGFLKEDPLTLPSGYALYGGFRKTAHGLEWSQPEGRECDVDLQTPEKSQETCIGILGSGAAITLTGGGSILYGVHAQSNGMQSMDAVKIAGASTIERSVLVMDFAGADKEVCGVQIALNQAGAEVQVAENEIFAGVAEVQGNGTSGVCGSPTKPATIRLTRNTITAMGAKEVVGIDLTDKDNDPQQGTVELRDNRILVTHVGNKAFGIRLAANDKWHEVLLERNTVEVTGATKVIGVWLSEVTNATVATNGIWARNAAIEALNTFGVILDSTDTVRLWHNTIVAARGSEWVGGVVAFKTTFLGMRNNILFTTQGPKHMANIGLGETSYVELQNNLLTKPAPYAVAVDKDGVILATYSDDKAMMAAGIKGGKGANQYVNPDQLPIFDGTTVHRFDLSPSAKCPAKDAGYDLNQVKSVWGKADYAVDLDGKPRPVGAFDIGAVELQP